MYRQSLIRRPRELLLVFAGSRVEHFALCVTLLVVPVLAWAASITVIPTDRNRGVEILDARSAGANTRLLYFTYPEAGQAHISERCTLNVYVADLRPGLADVQPQQIAENHCGSRPGFGGVLTNSGEIVIAADDRIETWDPAAGKLREWQFSEQAATTDLRANATEPTTHVALAPDGNVVLAESRLTDRAQRQSGVVAVGFSAAGDVRWRVNLEEPGVTLIAEAVWSASGGTALVQVSATAPGGASLPAAQATPGIVISRENRLYVIDPNGQAHLALALTRDQQPDLQAMQQAPNPLSDPAAFRRLLAGGVLENIRKLAVEAHNDGGYDVLIDRNSQDDTREGHFYYSVAPDGSVTAERSLSESIEEYGLDNWVAFTSDDSALVLYGTVTARKSESTRRKSIDQPSISRFDFASSSVVTRLLPVDERYLTAFLNAGDEQIQSLSDLPSGRPARLASLGDAPLGISIGRLSGRPAIRLDESTVQLAVYTQVRDARIAAAAAEDQRVQRRAASDAQSAALNAQLAAAAGLTPEAFATMSNRERTETLVREGDLDAVMVLVAQQAAAMQQALAAAEGGDTAAMAAAAAQLQGQTAGGSAAPTAATSVPVAPADDGAIILELDANLRGWVEFSHPNEQAVTMVIIDAENGREFVNRRYADGKVYEYVDFGRLGVALEQIGVVYTDENDQVLARARLQRP